ncbi:hypothetical protein N8648_04235 [Verrucomicrobia bacterium]|nr:hypothetical protein [Verrucomicrobiota bacterium]
MELLKKTNTTHSLYHFVPELYPEIKEVEVFEEFCNTQFQVMKSNFKLIPEILEELSNLQNNQMTKNRFLYTFKNMESTCVQFGGCIDLIYSQSVLEYMSNLSEKFQIMYKLLRDKGYVSHLIDLSCMRTSNQWYGHYYYNEYIWKFLSDKRPLKINRATNVVYCKKLQENKFRIILSQNYRIGIVYDKNKLAKPFHNITETNLSTKTLYLVAQKLL